MLFLHAWQTQAMQIMPDRKNSSAFSRHPSLQICKISNLACFHGQARAEFPRPAEARRTAQRHGGCPVTLGSGEPRDSDTDLVMGVSKRHWQLRPLSTFASRGLVPLFQNHPELGYGPREARLCHVYKALPEMSTTSLTFPLL